MTPMAELDDSTIQGGESDAAAALGKGVDWLVTALLVLGGLVAALFGFFLSAAADRAALAELVAEGTIQSTTLSDAELVDITYALAWWGASASASLAF
jgi:UPF0716 family protein affecting phage T7 exclusion